MFDTQYNMNIKVLRSDNGAKYVNEEFRSYLTEHGIVHQTTSYILLNSMRLLKEKTSANLKFILHLYLLYNFSALLG